MAVGATAGFAGINLPFSEAGVLASVFMLGGLVMAAVRLPLAAAMLVVASFAAFLAHNDSRGSCRIRRHQTAFLEAGVLASVLMLGG